MGPLSLGPVIVEGLSADAWCGRETSPSRIYCTTLVAPCQGLFTLTLRPIVADTLVGATIEVFAFVGIDVFGVAPEQITAHADVVSHRVKPTNRQCRRW